MSTAQPRSQKRRIAPRGWGTRRKGLRRRRGSSFHRAEWRARQRCMRADTRPPCQRIPRPRCILSRARLRRQLAQARRALSAMRRPSSRRAVQ
eukprot:1858097-Rhodomonas_salina.2